MACTVVGAIDGTLNQVFLLTTPLDPQTLANALRVLPGIVNAEVDQVLSLVPIGARNQYRSRFRRAAGQQNIARLPCQFRDDGVGQLRQSPAAGSSRSRKRRVSSK